MFNFKSQRDMLRVATPRQAQMANTVPDLQAQGGRWASSAVPTPPSVPPPRHLHTRPQAASYSRACPFLQLLPWPFIHFEPASPLSGKSRVTGSGEGCPHPTSSLVASAEEPEPATRPQALSSRRETPSALPPPSDPLGPCSCPLPFRLRNFHRPFRRPPPGPALAPQHGSCLAWSSCRPHHEHPKVLLPQLGRGWPLPSWPECSRCSCRSHPNTRSFALPFFFPFCRDFMAGAAGLWPSLRP